MIFERSVQPQFFIPMALSLGFGILFGTFITLLLIPCGYMIREDFIHLTNAIKARLISTPSSN
jgi:multidrug efflux pump subunit AcrB